MILQNEFQSNAYIDLLANPCASQYGIDLEDLFDTKQIPEELIAVYLSAQGDELFLVLNADAGAITALCDRWDERIRVFMIINGQSKAIEKLKYNIVQLIVYSGESPDKSSELNLMISRKIMIQGNLQDRNRIFINDSEAIELPFHLIPEKEFEPDKEKTNQLKALIPGDEALLHIMTKERKKASRRSSATAKSFPEPEFEMIKEWLEK